MKKIYYWHFAVARCLLLQVVAMIILMQHPNIYTEKTKTRI